MILGVGGIQPRNKTCVPQVKTVTVKFDELQHKILLLIWPLITKNFTVLIQSLRQPMWEDLISWLGTSTEEEIMVYRVSLFS